MTAASKILVAKAAGTVAFKVGMKRVPAFDRDVEMILRETPDAKQRIEVLTAWTRAWDAANLATVEAVTPFSGCYIPPGYLESAMAMGEWIEKQQNII